MHILSFLQKRTHLCAVARGREMFARIPHMTPARFDLFFLVFHGSIHGRSRLSARVMGYRIAQAKITEKLGLARQTVWKMAERLIALGLLRKSKARGNSRRNILELTEEGLRITREALRTAFTETKPLPNAAPAENPPRYWRRPEFADPADPPDAEAPPAPEARARAKKIGREVEKIYTAFAWRRCGRKGRRGRRAAQLNAILDLALDAEEMAAALGNTAFSIYSNRTIALFHA